MVGNWWMCQRGREGGSLVARAFIGWRVWKFFGLGAVFTKAYETFETIHEVTEQAQSWYETMVDMWESGELESILMGVGTLAAGLYVSWKGYKAVVDGSAAGSDTDSDGEIIAGTQVADSDDEPDARHLFAELSRGQHHLQHSTATLADVLGTSSSRASQRRHGRISLLLKIMLALRCRRPRRRRRWTSSWRS